MPSGTGRPHPALPRTATAGQDGVLRIGGCSVKDLVRSFGTPLYVYDLAEIRARLRECVETLAHSGSLHYAAKAYLATWLIDVIKQQDTGIDVCSTGELDMALRAGFPPERMRLHGNNKSRNLLEQALSACMGTIVVDNLDELEMLLVLARRLNTHASILIRLNPGIAAHTHSYLQTGVADSKFGLSIASGDARVAVVTALAAADAVTLLGYHAHIGTQILETAPYLELIDVLMAFARSVERESGFWPRHISPGGGFGITYTDETPTAMSQIIGDIRRRLDQSSAPGSIHLSVELGRAIVGPAGVTLYQVGTVKQIAGIRTYVAVDGGMADNIRPALYQSRYVALAACRLSAADRSAVTIAGPYCESGDILIHDAMLPMVAAGDIIALPATGAYCLPMSSNYNAALRPAVVIVEAGQPRLVQRRQTIDDLLSLDVR